MSLINNMLKELEKRESSSRYIPLTTLGDIQLRGKFSLLRKRMLFLSGLLLCFILITVIIFLSYKKKPPLLKQKTFNEHVLVQPVALVNEDNNTWLKPANVTGITLQVKDDITELSFLLDHAVLYRLSSDGMHNRLSLILDHAHLQSALPPVRYLHTAIQGLSAEEIHGDMRVTFTIAPDAIVKYINLNDEKNHPELVVAIASHHVTEPLISESNDFTKTPAVQTLLLQQYQDALSMVGNGYHQQAIKQLSSILKVDPRYKNARVSLVALLIDQGNTHKAIQVIDAGLNLSADYVPFFELKARVLAQQGKASEAIQLLQQVSPSLVDNPDYYALIAALYERINKNMLAVKLYKELLNVNIHNGSWWFGLGVSLDKLGYKKDAIQSYTRAVTEGHLNPASIAYLQNRLQALQEDDNAKE
ncbi:MAG: hypothetical protein A3E83_00560 [Gammaproteobacteria bacterium RIFCSPHIGHO2_12_FULL_41_20]|nr:MAG: hypothetical protein A3E83_00560 [Gammaproteobacteria bacterium RIFCSPHIGHO2_12_FULL_41_20]